MSDYLNEEFNNPAPSQTPNPFAGIITPYLHNLFTNAIDSLLQDCALTCPCRFIFGGTKFIDCDNCQGSIYTPGGPFPFPRGKICPACSGRKMEVEETQDVDMMVITDSRKWMILNRWIPNPGNTVTPLMYAETMCRIELYPKIKACKHIILNTCHTNYTHNIFKRLGEPEPCGLGKLEYIVTAWQKVVT